MDDEHLKLDLPPFEMAPDARFFYAAVPHQRALAYLGFALCKRQGFAVLTGEIGAGKTMLLDHLLGGSLTGRRKVGRFNAPRLDALGALRMTAGSFGLDRSGDQTELHARLDGALRRPEALGALLIVDEAQNLSPEALEELRILTNLQAGPTPLLQCLLVGQPQLRTLLARPALEQLRQRIAAAHHLVPLDAEDTRRYVAHRLAVAGRPETDALLEPEALDVVHAASGGVPRRINRLCDRLLLLALLERRRLTAADVAQAARELEAELPAPAMTAPRLPEAPQQTLVHFRSRMGGRP
ncbi:ExeA family protein [Rhodocista pekingensis]|uniref:ExeA family protein n=1 Tax=Rhodocista pekingensis TaxID=201185 RepID=A0ABW2L1Y2_9PROT